MGSADPADNRTFKGNFSDDGVTKLKEIVKVKLKEYMGEYTDDTLVEYVIVLLKNGRRKEEAKNEMKVFLSEDSDSFVAWLWDHLDEYFSSYIEQPITKDVLVSSENGAKRSRKWGSELITAPSIPPLLSSEIHTIDNYEKKDRRESRDKRLPPQQSESHRKRIRPDESRTEKRVVRPVCSRLLISAVRDALAIPKPSKSLTEQSLKRLRSVVSASDNDSARKIARVVNPMNTVIEAVAEDAKQPKSVKNVFDRITHDIKDSRNLSKDQESVQHHHTHTHSADKNGVYVENMTTMQTGLQSNVPSDRSKLVSSLNVPHRNHRTEVPAKYKAASFSGNVDTRKTARLEEQIKVPDVVLQRYMDRGSRFATSETITQSSTKKILGDITENGNIKPTASAKEDTPTEKSVPGTLSTTQPLEDASSRTIFVANVHFGATKDSLSKHFSKFGEVLKVVIVTDPATGQPSGSAYIEFTNKEAAENALTLDGTSFMSRILKIVKGSNVQQQEAASSTAWPRAGRFTRAASTYRRGNVALRGRCIVRGRARSMQWKRGDSTDTTNNSVTSTPRSLTYIRTESKPDNKANN